MEGGENKSAGNPEQMKPLEVMLALPAFVRGGGIRQGSQRGRRGSSGQGERQSAGESSTKKRPRGRPVGSSNKYQHKFPIENPGKSQASAAEEGQIKTVPVETGEDLLKNIASHAEEGNYRPLAILSASGYASSVTIQPLRSSAWKVTHEGHFRIVSLTGSLEPDDIIIQFASPEDGIVISGTVVGPLIAATPMKLILVASPPEERRERKSKKQRKEKVALDSGDSAVVEAERKSKKQIKEEVALDSGGSAVVEAAPLINSLSEDQKPSVPVAASVSGSSSVDDGESKITAAMSMDGSLSPLKASP